MKTKGLALIAVIVMIVLFSSLILAVVLSATISIRRANYYKDKLIALEIAEAGIQDVLYWMNYKGYYTNKRYPCTDETGTYNESLKYFRGSDYSDTDTWTNQDPLKEFIYNPTKIPGGRCIVEFFDADYVDNTNPDTDKDTIISTGIYKGKRAKISVRIRGSNGRGNSLHTANGRYLGDWVWNGSNWVEGFATWGIPEVLNKKVIYAKEVNGSGTNVYVKGNITCQNYNFSGSFLTNSETTLTRIQIDSSDVSNPDTTFYINIPKPTPIEAYFIQPPGYVDQAGRFLHEKTGTDTIVFPTSITKSGDDYTFTNTQIDYSFKICGDADNNGVPQGSANLKFSGTNTISKFVHITGDLTIEGTINLNNNAYFLVDGENLSISGTINGDLVLLLSNPTSINITNSIINNGALIVKIGGIGSSSLNITNLTINANNTKYKSAIIIYDESSGGLNISNFSLNSITANGKTKIFIYSKNGSPNITIDSDLSDNTINETPAVIIYGKNDASIELKNGKKISGIIYCKGENGNSSITLNLNSQVETGILITNGEVTLNNNVKIINYGRQLFPNNSEFYNAFVGGRRRYLPVPGSWRIEW